LFSPAQARRLLDAPDPETLQGLRDRAILSVGLQVGPRRAEIAGLKLKDFHMNAGYPALHFIRKGGEDHSLAIHPQAAERPARPETPILPLSGRHVAGHDTELGGRRVGVAGGALNLLETGAVIECAGDEGRPHRVRREAAVGPDGADVRELHVLLLPIDPPEARFRP
jgi:integrase